MERGAAALLATIIVTTVIVLVTISMVAVSFNTLSADRSYRESVESFFSAEAGLGEALIQIKKQPNNLTFENFTVNSSNVSTVMSASGNCPPDCFTNITSVATSTASARKVEYICDANISNCSWTELAP